MGPKFDQPRWRKEMDVDFPDFGRVSEGYDGVAQSGYITWLSKSIGCESIRNLWVSKRRNTQLVASSFWWVLIRTTQMVSNGCHIRKMTKPAWANGKRGVCGCALPSFFPGLPRWFIGLAVLVRVYSQPSQPCTCTTCPQKVWCYRCSEAQLTACFRENQLVKRTANERHVQTLLRNRKNLHDLQFETVFYRFEPVWTGQIVCRRKRDTFALWNILKL